MVQPIPEGYPRVTPYLVVRGAAQAITFYCDAFGAKERMRMPGPDGLIGHAELELGESLVMLSDEMPEMTQRSPEAFGGTAVMISLYVEDVDAVVAQAVQGGAKIVRPVADQFYGDRQGIIEDPFGHRWSIATHVEDVPDDEMERRVAEMMNGQ